MEFRTSYSRTHSKGEPGGGQIVVERKGYISNKVRIENMMLAGQRLIDYRKEKYDFSDGEEIDEMFIDPTRKKSFDLAEATQLQFETEERLRQQKAYAEKLAKEAQEALEAVKKPYRS